MKIEYNIPELDRVLGNVYEFIHSPITVYDEKFRYITACAEKGLIGYCQLVRRKSEKALMCRASDEDACQMCLCTGRRHSYRCHAGLRETVMPICYNDVIFGYIMFGEYRLKGDEIDTDKLAGELGVKTDVVRCEYEKASLLTEAQVEAACAILNACILQLCLSDAIFVKENERAERIKSFIDENADSGLTVEEVCREFSISRRQLYTVFKKAYKITVKGYILDRQLARAEHLLITTDYTVTDIAELSGFSDYNNFIQRFKQRVGVTPLAFRRRYTGG